MSQFPIFNSYLDLAPLYWQKILKEDDWAIDATCGNGKDTLKLAHLISGSGGVISLDIQEKAIKNSNNFFIEEGVREKIHLFHTSHAHFPDIAFSKPIRLIVYNLGYLPGGGDKTLTTMAETTLESLKQALALLLPGGLISITCYPGHPEGAKEEEALLLFLQRLSPSLWHACHHCSLNRFKSPSLLLIQKNS